MTTGSIYHSIITKERSLEYKGRCVSVVPDVPREIIEKINKAVKKNKAEIVIVEIGGTVGEYQNILFLEAVRMLKIENSNDTLLVLVSYLPRIGSDSEPKTKPTQHASRTLNSAGLQPDIIVARSVEAIDEKRKEKSPLIAMSGPGILFPLPMSEVFTKSLLILKKITLAG